jgi:hypothetical protein
VIPGCLPTERLGQATRQGPMACTHWPIRMPRVNCHRCPRPTNRPLTRRPTNLRYLCHRMQLQRRLRLSPPMRFPQKTRRRPTQAPTHLTPLSPPMHSRRSPVVDSPEVHSNNRGSRMWLRPSTLFSTQPPSVHLFHHNVARGGVRDGTRAHQHDGQPCPRAPHRRQRFATRKRGYQAGALTFLPPATTKRAARAQPLLSVRS